MGPQHPSTHGVLRLILTLDGETVTEPRPVIGYLHTGIEKNMEFRTWTQGVTFCTRMDYLSPLFNETAYCLAWRGCSASSRDPGAGQRPAGADDGAQPDLLAHDGHRHLRHGTGRHLAAPLRGCASARKVLDVMEQITGLRMNMAYIRPGGVARPAGRPLDKIGELLKVDAEAASRDMRKMLRCEPGLPGPHQGRRLPRPHRLHVAGRHRPDAAQPQGVPWDLRKSQPYCGYETYEFDVPTQKSADLYGPVSRPDGRDGRSRFKLIEQSPRPSVGSAQRPAK